MKNYDKYIRILVFGLVITISSCKRDTYEVPTVLITTPMSFANDVQPILTNNCSLSGCHITGGIAPDLSATNSYNNLSLYALIDTAAPTTSLIYMRLISTDNSNRMPPSGALQPTEIAKVLAWIKQGGLNN